MHARSDLGAAGDRLAVCCARRVRAGVLAPPRPPGGQTRSRAPEPRDRLAAEPRCDHTELADGLCGNSTVALPYVAFLAQFLVD